MLDMRSTTEHNTMHHYRPNTRLLILILFMFLCTQMQAENILQEWTGTAEDSVTKLLPPDAKRRLRSVQAVARKLEQSGLGQLSVQDVYGAVSGGQTVPPVVLDVVRLLSLADATLYSSSSSSSSGGSSIGTGSAALAKAAKDSYTGAEVTLAALVSKLNSTEKLTQAATYTALAAESEAIGALRTALTSAQQYIGSTLSGIELQLRGGSTVVVDSELLLDGSSDAAAGDVTAAAAAVAAAVGVQQGAVNVTVTRQNSTVYTDSTSTSASATAASAGSSSGSASGGTNVLVQTQAALNSAAIAVTQSAQSAFVWVTDGFNIAFEKAANPANRGLPELPKQLNLTVTNVTVIDSSGSTTSTTTVVAHDDNG
eukprot:15380-Heterococcus_DN1.PRE.4